MARFGNVKTKSTYSLTHLVTIAIFAGILVLFLWCVSIMSETNTEQQKESLENAIDRCVVQCYALEGTYPPSLAYMKEHYGLTYDETLFYVDYQSIGSNLPPDVTVILRNSEE